MGGILVVDDEPDLCEILCFNLESEGFATERAFSAESALELMEQGRTFDLILLDVMMERMSGFEMVRDRHTGNLPDGSHSRSGPAGRLRLGGRRLHHEAFLVPNGVGQNTCCAETVAVQRRR